MATRMSTRHAAAKANEALHENAQQGRRKSVEAGQKRKATSKKDVPEPKREKHTKDDAQKSADDAVIKEEPARDTTSHSEQEKREARKPQAHYAYVKDEEAEQSSEVKPSDVPSKKEPKETPVTKSEESSRDAGIPSNIMEEGIIYFFFRGKVGVEEPTGLDEVARTFIVLRPQPLGAKLSAGLAGGGNNCRLLLLPKKTVPTSSHEKYMGFVEKAGTDLKTLKESFLGEEYETKTRGTQFSPTATPLAEGVYALTSTPRTSHLAYILTIPKELSQVQKDFGLREKGSFIVASKNPKYPGPSSARLPKAPDYPQSVMDDFRDLRWVPLEPKFIDYPNAQFMMLGEAQGHLGKGGMTEGKALEQEDAGEELEHLELENEIRAGSLNESDKVFEDLGLSAKQFPQVPTTWE
ncbi:hypothetical protein MGYG_05864 [Nannizzia gypsea CBS 118893]|uniref:BTB domain transcription factor n=1 Tax=Arthroderma gypseum (strain ATCC MYA-4604 / CBS 118893) TaxID=535722 RepID=E4UZS6_ARTGP|nr:hypothetical protein MGYG_05864 [Nannizzia gypsea CBS 118893]EFR02863.1 hypothetical protein MGYG_05864 [Nannizzia gypsea CBS 118893]